MTKRASFMVVVAGTDISSQLSSRLISLTVTDNVGTHSDTATIELDDTDGRLNLPAEGVPVVISLGWEDGGVRPVFFGTVDEVRSSGSRSGRTISVSAKGVDTKSKAKEPQQRHFDDKSVSDILNAAGKHAGITVNVDPALASKKRKYLHMHDESFLHLGERIAREIGGNFRVQGKTATLSKRGGSYAPSVTAAWGSNLHSWDISPKLGRPQFGKAKARWYDREKAEWQEEEKSSSVQADAGYVARYSEPDKDQAEQRTDSDTSTSARDSADGSVTIEGNTGAVPDGMCIVMGARPGIDGPYRIESVTHNYSRSGFTTNLSLKSAF